MIVVPEPNKYNINSSKENYKLLYADEDSEHEIIVNDLDHMLNFFLPVCESCGNIMPFRKRRKICDICYKEKRKKDVLKNVKKYYY
jgi:recombinational DNA repair protein RecR